MYDGVVVAGEAGHGQLAGITDSYLSRMPTTIKKYFSKSYLLQIYVLCPQKIFRKR
jgi:hypothetical protein